MEVEQKLKTEQTAAPIFGVVAKNGEPEFGRWQDVERLYGIRRSRLYELMNEGLIQSVSLRQRGQTRGCRLFFLPSISHYLRSLLG